MSEPRLQFSFVCLGVDDQHGPPTFRQVVHDLPLPSLPYRFPESSGLFLVNGWIGGPGEFLWAARILDPDGAPVRDTGTRFLVLEDPDVPFLSIHFMQGIEFARPGKYRVEVLLDGRRVMDYALRAWQAPG